MRDSPEGSALPRAWQHSGLRALLLLLLTCLAYASSVHGGFVDLDTPWLVVENPILSTGSLRWLPSILWDMDQGTRLVLGAEYLPVRDLSVLADFALFGPRFAWHHAHNLAWYLLGCWLFLRVAEELIGQRDVAWLVAALFALHPVHVESVAWLASRKDVLGMAFFLAGVLIHLRGRGQRWRVGATTLCLVLAVWSKNTAIVLPVLLVAISLLHHREDPLRPSWWPQWVPLGLATVALLAVSLSLGEQVAMYAPVRGGSTAAALLLETRVIFHYLGMILWPAELIIFYPEPPLLPLAHPASITALAGVLIMLAAVPLLARRQPLIALGLAWFFLGLLPVSQLVPIQNLMADRYLLLPLGGLLLALAPALVALRERWGLWPFIVGLVLALSLGVASFQQNRTWRSSEALWRHSLALHPDHHRVRRNLAGVLEAQGRHDEAIAVLQEGLDAYGEQAPLLAGLGLIALQQGRSQDAERMLSRAWELDDGMRKAGANLLSLLQSQDRIPEALALGEVLTGTHPSYAKGWNNHGSALMAAGRLDEAQQVLERAVALDPFYATPCCNLALVGLQRGQPVQAVPWAERCVELDPDNRRARDLLEAVRASGP
jgi:Tfp pilus assembly protein PilF